MNLKEKVLDGVSKVKTYWKTPMSGRHMTFREIAAYSGGGIGAYMIITMGTACLLAANNTLLSSVLGIAPMDMYIMYVIAVVANIPLTAVRANIIDNTRNKAGKYRPYIVTMAIPAAIICVTMVWFPYDSLNTIFGDRVIFDKSVAYIVKCAIVMVLNLFLHFFYYFFYDGYENLIHVLSPNSQERADVSSVKSIVYSFAPTVVNLFTPLIAQHIFHSNSTDIRVYRLLYPILSVLGLILCIIVYKYTEEKIVQARTHVVQIKFSDALKAVAKNKYFWIISLASWIGFLESSYANIMKWLYDYGGACSGTTFGIIQTVYGNASLWGMLAAPFCIRKWGKKSVLIVTNIFNILFILAMLLFTDEITYNVTILLIMSCLWLNALMGSFMHILNPAIQADIRDYQQYKTGERIDGMFSAVNTIGTVLALATSSVLPFIYKQKGITEENAKIVTSDPEILNRVMPMGDDKFTTVGKILEEQLAKGQDNYSNAYSALYDPDILLSLINVLVVVAAFGALMNVIPFFWYDFNERKQKSVVRILQIRAMFEDYGNGVLNDKDLVETLELIHKSREMAVAEPKVLDKKTYKSLKDKEARKLAKKQYLADKEFNEEIEIAKLVCEELDKFETVTFQKQIEESAIIYNNGLEGLLAMDINKEKENLARMKSLPKGTKDEKETRKALIEIARQKVSSCKEIAKNFSNGESFARPDYSLLQKNYDKEDAIEKRLNFFTAELRKAKKNHNEKKVKEIKKKISAIKAEFRETTETSKVISDAQANFNRAAKPYLDAEKLLCQKENYSHLEEIELLYKDAKFRNDKAIEKARIEKERKLAAEKAENERIKAQKAAAKEAKKQAKEKAKAKSKK
ncbi:MAG: MFS transporter [Clostridia bacterium]|nr:MFS transporter [Clostridia bacterium]